MENPWRSYSDGWFGGPIFGKLQMVWKDLAAFGAHGCLRSPPARWESLDFNKGTTPSSPSFPSSSPCSYRPRYRRLWSGPGPELMPERIPDRMPEKNARQNAPIYMSERTLEILQDIKICQTECQNYCQKECQKECQNICQKVCQNRRQIEC